MVVNCRNCSAKVEVPDARQPWRYAERDTDDHNGTTLLIIGRDHLLHMCTVAAVKN